MFKNTQLKYTECPTCGSPIQSFSRGYFHINGYFRDEIKFECECCIEFTPNFMAEQILTPCPQSPENLELVSQRRKAIDKVLSCITELETDDKFRKILLHAFHCIARDYNLT